MDVVMDLVLQVMSSVDSLALLSLVSFGVTLTMSLMTNFLSRTMDTKLMRMIHS